MAVHFDVHFCTFLMCFRQFYFLTQSDDFAKAIAFALRPFLPIFELSHFWNIRSFLKGFFLPRITILWL